MENKSVVVAEQDEEDKSKKAFIVTPVGASAEVRRATDGLIRSVLKPVLEEYGYEAVASHQEDDLGSISLKIIKHLLEDDLVIVNLSTLNANVMYELGIRHATGKPVILISDSDTTLPFDTKDQRTIFYYNDMMGSIELRDKLKGIVSDEAKLSSNEGNPIFMAANDSVLNKAIFDKIKDNNIGGEERDLVEMVLSKMESFEKKISFSQGQAAKKEAVKNNFLNAFCEYVAISVSGHGLAKKGDYYYIGVNSEWWYGSVLSDLKSRYVIDNHYSMDGIFIIVVLNKGGHGIGGDLAAVIEEHDLPF